MSLNFDQRVFQNSWWTLLPLLKPAGCDNCYESYIRSYENCEMNGSLLKWTYLQIYRHSFTSAVGKMQFSLGKYGVNKNYDTHTLIIHPEIYNFLVSITKLVDQARILNALINFGEIYYNPSKKKQKRIRKVKWLTVDTDFLSKHFLLKRLTENDQKNDTITKELYIKWPYQLLVEAGIHLESC